MLRIQFLVQEHLVAAGASPTRSIRRRQKTEKHYGKFQYLAGLIGCSALACTFESYSVLGYMYLYLAFEFEVMGLELAGWFAGTFCRACIYLAERPFLLYSRSFGSPCAA